MQNFIHVCVEEEWEWKKKENIYFTFCIVGIYRVDLEFGGRRRVRRWWGGRWRQQVGAGMMYFCRAIARYSILWDAYLYISSYFVSNVHRNPNQWTKSDFSTIRVNHLLIKRLRSGGTFWYWSNQCIEATLITCRNNIDLTLKHATFI